MSDDLQAVDALLAAVGLEHGRRRQLGAGWVPDARRGQRQGPEAQQKAPRVPELVVYTAGTLAGVPHGFAGRTGGVSTAYGEADDLNLGFTASDARETILGNRERLLERVFGGHPPLATLKQVHSSVTHRVGREEAGLEAKLRGDGLMTDEPGVVLGIQTADCVPVLLADRKRGAVGVFHAGWRGTLKRIVEGGVGRMRAEFGTEPEDLRAAIGPAIGACCYSVGEEVQHEFRSQFHYADELFSEVYDADPVRKKYPMLFLTQRAPGHSPLGPSLHLDLGEANRRQLLDAGVRAESIEVLGKCTSCRTDLFFSYRAEQGFTGRMLSVIAAG